MARLPNDLVELELGLGKKVFSPEPRPLYPCSWTFEKPWEYRGTDGQDGQTGGGLLE
ncbi:hypothetical protein [Ktedonobacter racemifer]|uniref:Uncharacterized protein n=1 Tax=Ktedonobacter racemifer DSM 44963 TaxID=485913 RepID=D6TUT6_KTERA|nr:hypothetical protein [Ktedonobacter racemifer]EFH85262.1 hypothetical protein Krac_6445 [Ktedonobacter racemifer DSM 44963]